MNFYSQYQQDQFIFHNLLGNIKSPIFVDIGAHDGVTGSNTKFFEEHLGWTGLCFEPNPQIFDLLVKNRQCQCIMGAAWDKDEMQTFRMITGYSEMLSGLVSEISPDHAQRIETECQQMNGSYSDIEVVCYDLNSLLLSNDISHVGYMSIDTEGSESRIVKSLDLGRLTVDVFSIENNYGDSDISDYLTSNGYRQVARLTIDDIYVRI